VCVRLRVAAVLGVAHRWPVCGCVGVWVCVSEFLGVGAQVCFSVQVCVSECEREGEEVGGVLSEIE